jgi:hypothetical protein
MTTVHLESVDTGTPNQGDGSTIREAFEIVNDNVDKLNLQLNGSRSNAEDNQVTYISAAHDISANSGAVYGLNVYGGVVFSRGSEVLTSSSGSWNGGNVSLYGIFANTDPSTSTTTGVLQVFGGAGIQGNLFLGGLINVAGNASVGNLTAQNTSVANLSATGRTTVGSLTVAGTSELIGNLTVANVTVVGTTIAPTIISSIGNIANLQVGTLSAGSTTLGATTLTAANATVANITGTTASTSTSTGALRVAGGVGIEGNAFVGGTIHAGAIRSIDSTEFKINAPHIYLESDSVYPYDYDIGFYGHFIGGTANTYGHTGFVRNNSENMWHLFSNIAEPVGGEIDVNDPNIVYDPLHTGTHEVVGDVLTSGNVRANASVISIGNMYANSYLYANGAPYSGTFSNANVQSYLTAGTTGITAPSITHSGTTGAGNIGSVSNTFGTIFGVATTAQYADLAENYVSDAAYPPGTVVEFGGDFEVTLGTPDTPRVAGVVSTDPAYLMNSHCSGAHVVAVALTGRVPCQVVGPVQKGDMIVSAGDGKAKASPLPVLGSVIGKSLENFNGASGVIEIVVGRL